MPWFEYYQHRTVHHPVSVLKYYYSSGTTPQCLAFIHRHDRRTVIRDIDTRTAYALIKKYDLKYKHERMTVFPAHLDELVKEIEEASP